ncbi:MAG: Gfo/Idh/MocA family oxidoreductase [Acidobacteria bacterium]|nr:Gfo/Idh/MocA family oxidoreductase [Acidobacteriota bacterium]
MTRLAVVGVGALGEHHARIYSELPDAELVAVVDIDQGKAQQVASRYHCQSYQRYEEILDSVEAISLAVPTREHARIGVEFLKRDVHVLVEKPIAQNLEEADQLIQAQKKSGALLQVGHSERFNPALLAVKPLVRQPKFFETHRLGIFTPRSLDVDVILDLMIHDLDVIISMVAARLAVGSSCEPWLPSVNRTTPCETKFSPGVETPGSPLTSIRRSVALLGTVASTMTSIICTGWPSAPAAKFHGSAPSIAVCMSRRVLLNNDVPGVRPCAASAPVTSAPNDCESRASCRIRPPGTPSVADTKSLLWWVSALMPMMLPSDWPT